MALAGAFDKYFSAAVTSVASELDSWVESFDPFRFSEKYKSVLRARHSVIKILGMSKPVDISSIYIDVIAYNEIPSRIYVDYNELDEYLRKYDRGHLNLRRETGLRFVKRAKRALILGKPGSGKTTFLKYLLTLLLSDTPPFKGFPVFVSLKEFSEYAGDNILDFITADFDKYCNFPAKNARPFIERMFRNGYCVLLLDGLDEVSVPDRSKVISEIERVSAKFPESKFVVSCRAADYQGWFTNFEEVELADFTQEQAYRFITMWFKADKARQQALLEAYSSSDHIQELCSVPLMAALMCILFQYKLGLPENRAELYAECIDALLYKWDANRLINRTTRFSALSTHKKKTLFSKIGFHFMQQQKVVFSFEELCNPITNFLRSLTIDDTSSVLTEISANHAVLLERSSGFWSFIHLTFQEYFAASYVVQNRTEKRLADYHFTDPRWREVIIMTSSLLPDASVFIDAVAKNIVKLPHFKRYRPYIHKILSHSDPSPLYSEQDAKQIPKKNRPRMVLGLREAKDIVDELFNRAPSICGREIGDQKIQQIKAVRNIGHIYKFLPLLKGKPRTKLVSLYETKAMQFSNDDIASIANDFGDKPFDAFWLGFGELQSYIDLFYTCCFESGSLVPREAIERSSCYIFQRLLTEEKL
jgi:energy-coupling factor transporter ATP-binding protein EcfA2